MAKSILIQGLLQVVWPSDWSCVSHCAWGGSHKVNKMMTQIQDTINVNPVRVHSHLCCVFVGSNIRLTIATTASLGRVKEMMPNRNPRQFRKMACFRASSSRTYACFPYPILTLAVVIAQYVNPKSSWMLVEDLYIEVGGRDTYNGNKDQIVIQSYLPQQD